MTAQPIALARLQEVAENPLLVPDAVGLLGEFNAAGVLEPLDVLSVMRLGRLLGEARQEVLLAAALTVRGSRLGHVCIDLATQQSSVTVDDPDVVIDFLRWPDASTWAGSIADSSLVGDAAADTPLVLDGGLLYLRRYLAYERAVAAFVQDRVDGSDGALDPAIDDELRARFEDESGAPNLQLVAARKALTGRFTVIAGGPGTGKTRTAAATLVALARAADEFPHVALVAPTGKAAARLGEAIRDVTEQGVDERVSDRLDSVEASTIHRLLGWSRERGRFRHDTENRLPHDLIIVDEMSMVSLPLAAKLMSALRDDASIVLIGDPGQLESIEAGTVLADIVGRGLPDADEPLPKPAISARVVTLDRVHRFDEEGGIADFAAAVAKGDADGALQMLESGRDDLSWVTTDSGRAEVLARIVEQRRAMIELAQQIGTARDVLDLLDKLAVVAAHRIGPSSVDEWRRTIEDRLDSLFPQLRRGQDWYPGQPVMITRNDYGMNLYNGDIGVVVTTEEGLRVAFDKGDVRLVERSRIQDHTTVHAMTIHKSQGSGFQTVVVALPSAASRLPTRELLYTAVTRASERVVILGDEPTIRHAIERSVPRASGLGRRLWTAAGG